MTSPSNSEQNVRSGEISEKNVDMFKKKHFSNNEKNQKRRHRKVA